MQSLLRWGIENSPQDPIVPPPVPRQDIDPGIIDHILGKPDAELMKEALAIAKDESKSEDDRMTALDNFEMLIEQIDNANNISALNMWPQIHKLLGSDSDVIKANTLWIIGTAVQNNPAAQKACLSFPSDPLSVILSILSSSSESGATRSKAAYALSGLLKHNAEAVRSLEKANGWNTFKQALHDSDITVRRKIAFLLNTLLLPSTISSSPSSSSGAARIHGDTHEQPTADPQAIHPNSHGGMTPGSCETSTMASEAMEKFGVIDSAIDALVNPTPHGTDGEHEGDADLSEKLVRLLFTYLTNGPNGHLDRDKRFDALRWLKENLDNGEHWDLGQGEVKELERMLS
ncbi:Fes1-domain-containing protein [Rickenella mellea]|uniref:Fes1-domain-containing protein n=1 Tax=Rickenella mellea TaxID=50990 RepID=A0A4Y7QI61_9AGAM|nr:Fes1-domain-containing protein [Rickenella mellea]